MNSAGNDIVALTAIDVARTRQPQFYSRIITPAEQELYSLDFKDQLAFEHFVWLAWSVKESAYKFLKRFEPQLVFSPTRMVTSGFHFTGEYFEGTVQSGDHLLYSRSLVSKEYIFSMVNREKDFSNMCFEIGQISSDESLEQSGAVRKLLFNKLRQVLSESALHITKSPHGWPIILSNEGELPIPVSFTHHGHFVAYTYHLSLTSWKAYPHHAEVL